MHTKEQIKNIGQQIIDALLSYGKEQILLFYLCTNTYKINYYANDYIDCIVSNAPLKFPFVFNGKPANIENIELFGTSMPLYFGYYTNNNHICLDIFSRTYDVKFKEDTEFIIDDLVKKIDCE